MSSAAQTQPWYQGWHGKQQLWGWAAPFPFSLSRKWKQRKSKRIRGCAGSFRQTRNLNQAKFQQQGEFFPILAICFYANISIKVPKHPFQREQESGMRQGWMDVSIRLSPG